MFKILRKFSSLKQMKKLNYYQLLEIDERSSMIQIKRAYFEKVKLYHPDTNKESDAEESFKLIVNAYEHLKDPSKRQIYDLSQQNPNFDENRNYSEDQFYNQEQKHQGPKYYENKWYGFQKDTKEKTQRDEYYETGQVNDQEKMYYLGLRIGFVCFSIIFFDFIKRYSDNQHQIFINTQREILEQSRLKSPLFVKSEDSISNLNDYIDLREKEVSKLQNEQYNQY